MVSKTARSPTRLTGRSHQKQAARRTVEAELASSNTPDFETLLRQIRDGQMEKKRIGVLFSETMQPQTVLANSQRIVDDAATENYPDSWVNRNMEETLREHVLTWEEDLLFSALERVIGVTRRNRSSGAGLGLTFLLANAAQEKSERLFHTYLSHFDGVPSGATTVLEMVRRWINDSTTDTSGNYYQETYAKSIQEQLTHLFPYSSAEDIAKIPVLVDMARISRAILWGAGDPENMSTPCLLSLQDKGKGDLDPAFTNSVTRSPLAFLLAVANQNLVSIDRRDKGLQEREVELRDHPVILPPEGGLMTFQETNAHGEGIINMTGFRQFCPFLNSEEGIDLLRSAFTGSLFGANFYKVLNPLSFSAAWTAVQCAKLAESNSTQAQQVWDEFVQSHESKENDYFALRGAYTSAQRKIGRAHTGNAFTAIVAGLSEKQAGQLCEETKSFYFNRVEPLWRQRAS